MLNTITKHHSKISAQGCHSLTKQLDDRKKLKIFWKKNKTLKYKEDENYSILSCIIKSDYLFIRKGISKENNYKVSNKIGRVSGSFCLYLFNFFSKPIEFIIFNAKNGNQNMPRKKCQQLN